MNYLQVKNGRFTRDLVLGFDYTTVNDPRAFVWKLLWDCSGDLTQPIDISQIPPSIFLLALVNTMSSGFDLYIPTDMTYSEFFQRLAEQFSQGYLKACEYNPGHGVSSFLFNPEAFNLDYLDQHGTILEPDRWLRYLMRHDRFYCDQGKSNDTLQGIASKAQDFWDILRR